MNLQPKETHKKRLNTRKKFVITRLQQVTILLQGTRHSEREDIISQLEIILSRLKNGENTGFEHDDDFGYSFQYDAAAVGKSSFFDEAAGRK